MMTDRPMSMAGAYQYDTPWCLTANTGGTLPPIVFLHTWETKEPAQFDALAREVGPLQPLYAVRPPDVAALARFDRVADWVAYMRRRLDQLPVQPPYRLAGWSFGGVVALELARALSVEGVAVTTVDLVDTWLPHHVPRTGRERLVKHVRILRRLPKSDRRRYVRVKAHRFPRAVADFGGEKAHNALNRVRRRVDADQPKIDPRLRAIWVPYFKYVPSAYPDPVTIYSSDKSVERNLGDEAIGWSPWLTGGLDVVRLPGTHDSLWGTAHIDVLAAALTKRSSAAPT
jgi:thioesterase domain-containing protein